MGATADRNALMSKHLGKLQDEFFLRLASAVRSALVGAVPIYGAEGGASERNILETEGRPLINKVLRAGGVRGRR